MPQIFVLGLSGVAFLIVVPVFGASAHSLTRSEAARYIREGEYAVSGKKVHRIVSRKKTGRPGKKSISKKHQARKHSKTPLPFARETARERDMPFISIPHTRIKQTSQTIIMDDPNQHAAQPSLPLGATATSPEPAREPATFDLRSDTDPVHAD